MLEISVEAHEELSKLLKANGFAHVDKIKIPEKEFSKWLHECEAQHPEESYEQHFLRVCYRYACHKFPAPEIEEPEYLTAREFRWWAVALIVLLIIGLAQRAHGQIDVITFQDASAVKIKGFAGPFKIQCSTNVTCSAAGNTLSITASASGATAWSGITAATNVNAGSFISTGNTFDFSGVTLMKFRFSAGLTTSTNGDCGYDTTNNRWHCWQGGADRLMIASTNVGVSGQAFLSNADGSGAFADPIVSGPDAVGATPTKNPVQIGGLFLTTPATLTNNQVGAAQLDSVQNLLVHVNFALPTGSNVIGHIIADTGSTTAVTGTVASNVTQFGGTNVSTGTGAGGAGIPRVTISNDSSLAANQSVNVNQLAGSTVVPDPCQVNAKVYDSFSVTSSTQLISGTSAKKIYFCSWNDQSAAAENYAIVEGTGSVCATGIAKFPGLSGGTTAATGWNVPAGGGRTMGNGTGAIAQEGTNADNVCILLSGSTQVNGGYSYVVQ